MNYQEPKSACDVMMSQAYKPVTNVLAEKIIARKKLSGATKYDFCPFCVERERKSGVDYLQFLKPLWVVTYKMACLTSSDYVEFFFEKRYECPICKDYAGKPRVVTVDDFVKAYCEKPKELVVKGTKLTPQTLAKIEKGDF